MSDELLKEIRDALVESNKRGDRIEAQHKEQKAEMIKVIRKFTFACFFLIATFLFLQILF